MALQDIAASLTDPGSVPHKTCGACHALAGMDPAEATVLRGLLADRGVRFMDLAKALAEDPDSPTIHHDVLSRHARGLCAAREVLR
jgi:hypothetical protein